MTGRRILYLAALIGCTVFYLAYREWFAWFLLSGVIALPVFSILLTLPTILAARPEADIPAAVNQGTEIALKLTEPHWLQPPALYTGVPLRNMITEEEWTLSVGQPLPTGHCGALRVKCSQMRVYDYLGLFAFPMRKAKDVTMLVRPAEQPMDRPPQPNRSLSGAWVAKPGSFSEDHELRQYRPGDDLHMAHWKLSAKTGKLIIREPIVPRQDMTGLDLELNGSPQELDIKLGRALWLSRHLVEQNIPHEIRCLTGRGTETFAVSTAKDAIAAIDSLLAAAPAPAGAQLERHYSGWHHHIGGGADE